MSFITVGFTPAFTLTKQSGTSTIATGAQGLSPSVQVVIDALGAGGLLEPGDFGSLADRATHDDEAKDFIFLRTDTAPILELYIKGSATSGDWLGPYTFKGDDAAAFTFSAVGAPSDGLGNDGDTYLDLVAGDTYKKASGTWGAAVGNIRGPAGSNGLGWTGASYNSGTGIISFVSDHGLGFVTDDLRGDDGLGWTGASYNAGTGIVTFTSTDGLGFSTGDLRGADGLGVPAGGTTGQVLSKQSNTDNDTDWVDLAGGGDMASATYDPGGKAEQVLTIGDLLDEDNFASNANDKAASQQSIAAYVGTEIANLIDSSPGALDTLNELAAALGNDPNFSTTITNALAGKQPLNSGLSAIAALTTLTFGRSLLELADGAALRTEINVEDGADVTDEANVKSAIDGATLDDIGTPASGDKVLIRDASAGNALKEADFSEFGGGGGGGATPLPYQRGIGALTQQGSTTSLSGSGTVNITGLGTDWDVIFLVLDEAVSPGNNAEVDARVSDDNGSTYETTVYKTLVGASVTEVDIYSGGQFDISNIATMVLAIYSDPNTANRYFTRHYYDEDLDYVSAVDLIHLVANEPIDAIIDTSAAVNAFQFFVSTSTFSGGDYLVFTADYL